jgi:putative hemolysin
MHEIGRLREISFRDVGEGSGKSIDLDRFDETYMQIIVWNREAKEIIGAYRAGVVRVVTKDIGTDGLYTSTLFNYSPSMLDALGDAVELGRSFVRPEYQRQPLPLALLWKGIGRFMIAGGHRRMFGPISISNDYQSMSKELIMEFLERHRLAAPFAKLVSPRNPPTRRDIAGWTDRERAEAVSDITHVERLIEEIERGQRAVPVLLRQYLRLNAKLLAFNVDADFGEVIDALMLFDMMQIDERILGHYVGEEGMQILRARFGKAQPEHDERG